jgi:hypothetical protein
MTANVDLPADHDLCITVISGGSRVLFKYGLKEAEVNSMMASVQSLVHSTYMYANAAAASVGAAAASSSEFRASNVLEGVTKLPLIGALTGEIPVIVLFAQWANTEGPTQKYDNSLLHAIQRAVPCLLPVWKDVKANAPQNMSNLASKWVFPVAREFSMPYDKRTYVTLLEDLASPGWVQATANQIDDLVKRTTSDGVHAVVQTQHYGGTKFRYRTNEDGVTSYCWRHHCPGHGLLLRNAGHRLVVWLLDKAENERHRD